MPLIVDNLTIGYHARSPVAGPLNSQLQMGELVCLMGSNGAGKTTLLRTISGIHKPLAGNTLIDGQNLNITTEKDRARKISVVLTERIHSGFMTVEEFVGFGRYPHTNWQAVFSEKDKHKVTDALVLVEMQSIAHQKLGELSDGNLQKALIARALAQDTDYIILDEPTIHLDLKNRVMVLQLLSNLTIETGKGIILASHDLEMMLQLADVFWLIDDCKLTTGVPEDLMINGTVEAILGTPHYDLRKGELIRNSSNGSVSVLGTGEKAVWIKRALIRKGHELVTDASIQVSLNDDTIILNIQHQESQHHSIESLLSKMAQHDKKHESRY